MYFNKFLGFLALTGACLLQGCGGGGSDTPVATVKDAYVYMAGGFVEGLTYSTETQSGTTGPRGLFKYQQGETVTFKVGNQTLTPYKIKLSSPLPLTHFDILGTRNPNATVIQNLSVLLHMLDEDGDVSNGIKISATKLDVANRVTDALPAETYRSSLATEADKANLVLPNLGTVLALATAQMKANGVAVAPYAFGSASFNEFNSVITLSAAGSADANSDNLKYNWTIESRPKSSTAVIVNPTSISPTVVVDAFDEPFIFRLTVTDSGGLNSVTPPLSVTVVPNPNGGVTGVKDAFVYMAGGFVEGLTYSTETQSGTTGPRGLFRYQQGETVTFKVGNQTLTPYKINLSSQLPLTHFDILGTRNPNATVIQNLSVLLHMLDEDGDISNGIKISATKLDAANRVTDALQAETYRSSLATEADKANLVLPKLGTVLALATAQMKADGVVVAPYAFGSASFNEFNGVITLSAAGSADANSDNLKYNWTIESRPKSSTAVIVNPTSIEPTVVVDAFDEPFIFRLTVTDSGGLNSVAPLLSVMVERKPIAGVYTKAVDANTRQLVAITDTGELWGYAVSSTPNRIRRFTGPMARTSDSLPQYSVSPVAHQTMQSCSSPCPDPDRMDLTANFTGTRSISITNDWANSFLFESVEPTQLSAGTLSDKPLQIADLEATYREKDAAPGEKDWTITAKGEFSLYKTLADGKRTLCAIGQIAMNKDGQVLNRQGFVTRYSVPVSIEFKNECDENFDVGTTSTGYFLPDPTLGNAGFSFLGKNASGSRMFLRHFIKQ